MQKLKILLQMSLVMLVGLKKPIIRVGRMAGQYAKPRSADFETKGGVSLPSYRGDIINRLPFTAADREPDPAADAARLRARGAHAELRALADRRRLRRPAPSRELGPCGSSASRRSRRSTTSSCKSVSDSLEFFETISGEPMHRDAPRRVLRVARRAASAVRAGADALPAAPAALVQPDDALSVDRHAHRGSRGRARRVLPRHRESDGGQDRHGRHGRAAPAADPRA